MALLSSASGSLRPSESEKAHWGGSLTPTPHQVATDERSLCALSSMGSTGSSTRRGSASVQNAARSISRELEDAEMQLAVERRTSAKFQEQLRSTLARISDLEAAQTRCSSELEVQRRRAEQGSVDLAASRMEKEEAEKKLAATRVQLSGCNQGTVSRDELLRRFAGVGRSRAGRAQVSAADLIGELDAVRDDYNRYEAGRPERTAQRAADAAAAAASVASVAAAGSGTVQPTVLEPLAPIRPGAGQPPERASIFYGLPGSVTGAPGGL